MKTENRSTKLPITQNDITLCYYLGTRAIRARWMLEELGLDYQLQVVNLRQGEQKTQQYLAIHPLGKVPALKIGTQVIFESLAICLYLADHFDQAALAPGINAANRAEYYQWMALSTGTLEPAIIEQSRIQKAEAHSLDAVDMGPVLTPFSRVATYIERTLSKREYLLGMQFSAADIMTCSLMNWAHEFNLLDDMPVIKDWLTRLQQRPAYQRAIVN